VNENSDGYSSFPAICWAIFMSADKSISLIMPDNYQSPKKTVGQGVSPTNRYATTAFSEGEPLFILKQIRAAANYIPE
jgi:hypothetical protein